MKQKMPIWKKILREILRPFYQMWLITNGASGGEIMSNQEIAKDKADYTRLNMDKRFVIDSEWDYLCLGDKYAPNGVIDSQYFIQDIWGARKVLAHKPDVHYDVGITYIQANATRLENIADNSIHSLSALCSIEHFGLGRYGDPIEPDAWEGALKAFQRVLKPNGRLYLSVPVADEDRLCFNAHRIYKPQTIIDSLDSMQIIEMGYIKDFDVIECMKWENNNLHINKEALESMPKAHKRSCCFGLFEFAKK